MIVQISLKTLREDNKMVKNDYTILSSENFYPSDIKFNKDGLIKTVKNDFSLFMIKKQSFTRQLLVG